MTYSEYQYAGRRHRLPAVVGVLLALIGAPAAATADARTAAPDLQIKLDLHYRDPTSGATGRYHLQTNGSASRPIWHIPAGAKARLTVTVVNRGGSLGGDGATIDLWWHWPRRAPPTVNRPADEVCIPQHVDGCRQVSWPLPAGAGQHLRMVVWVDRHGVIPDVKRRDNRIGPVTVAFAGDRTRSEDGHRDGHLRPPAMRPGARFRARIIDQQKNARFSLYRGQDNQAWSVNPRYPGELSIQARWAGSAQRLALEVHKRGALVWRQIGRSPLTLQLPISATALRRGRAFDIRLRTLDDGNASGELQIRYPAHARYILQPPAQSTK